MRSFSNTILSVIAIAILFGGSTIFADAQTRANERQTRGVLRSLNTKLDDFRYSLEDQMSRSSMDQQSQDDLQNALNDLDDKLASFRNSFNRRSESSSGLSDLLTTAATLDDEIGQNRFDSQLQKQWQGIRTLFDQLAVNYRVSPKWNRGRPVSTSSDPRGNYNNGLTGTYQLDAARSEKARDIADRAISDSTPNAEEARADLADKLEAPEKLAIELLGNRVSLASTLASQISVTADGRDRTETLSDGTTLRLRATLRGQELTVSSVGGDNDYTVTFTSQDEGRGLKVTRRITASYLTGAIFAESYYDKTDAVAQFDIYNSGANSPTATTGTYPSTSGGNYPSPPTTSSPRTGNFIVPDGTILTATLDNLVSTKISQNNDPFSMTVTKPFEYKGAIIEGYLSGIDRASKIKGRSQLTFNFERIRLKGQTYEFAGAVQTVVNEKGEQVKVDTEGTTKGKSQTKETVKRGGIGAGLGALIGAVIGGPKGAAIGAIIGGSAGAGSVYVIGSQDVELNTGSIVTIQSSSPTR